MVAILYFRDGFSRHYSTNGSATVKKSVKPFRLQFSDSREMNVLNFIFSKYEFDFEL